MLQDARDVFHKATVAMTNIMEFVEKKENPARKERYDIAEENQESIERAYVCLSLTFTFALSLISRFLFFSEFY